MFCKKKQTFNCYSMDIVGETIRDTIGESPLDKL